MLSKTPVFVGLRKLPSDEFKKSGFLKEQVFLELPIDFNSEILIAMPTVQRPDINEYGEYYRDYVQKVGSDNIFTILSEQMDETISLIKNLTPEQALYRYAEGKWTVKKVIGHMIDSERVFAYRGLSFSRGEQQDLPGFDQDTYVSEANFDNRSLGSFEAEYAALRKATLALFGSLSEESFLKKGKANSYSFTVRSILYIIAGHERHHLDILRSKYGLEPA